MAKKSSKSPAPRASVMTDAATLESPGDAIQPVEVALPAEPARSADQAKPAKRAKATATTPPADSTNPSPRREVDHQRIAERAYELYNLGAPGSPMDHWLQAEHELRGS